MNPLRTIAWRNVRRHWHRSLAVLLSISAGFAAICLFEGFIGEIRREFEDGYFYRGMYGHLIVESSDKSFKNLLDDIGIFLDMDQQSALEAFFDESPEVDVYARFVHVAGLVTTRRSSTAFIGVGHDVAKGVKLRGEVWKWNVVEGEPLYQSGGEADINVGVRLAALVGCRSEWRGALYRRGGGIFRHRPLHCETADVQLQGTSLSGRMNAVDARIVGTIDSGLRELDDKFILMPLELAQELLDTHGIGMYVVRLKNADAISGFQTRLSAFALSGGIPIQITRWQDHPVHGLLYRQTMSLLSVFRWFVLSIVVVIVWMTLVTTLTRSVIERTREIGTLRSIGYNRRHIVVLFMWEGFFLAALGCALGWGLVALIAAGLEAEELGFDSGITSYEMILRVSPPLEVYVLVALFLVTLAMLGAVRPALRVARGRISDALRHI